VEFWICLANRLRSTDRRHRLFVTLYLAIRTPDPVIDDYYRKGMEINKTLNAQRDGLAPALQARNHAATESSQYNIKSLQHKSVPMNLDIAIIGAGPAGLCFARALAESGLRIVVLERQTEAALSHLLLMAARLHSHTIQHS